MNPKRIAKNLRKIKLEEILYSFEYDRIQNAIVLLEEYAELKKIDKSKNKTLTKLCNDLDVELWKGMEIADQIRKDLILSEKEIIFLQDVCSNHLDEEWLNNFPLELQPNDEEKEMFSKISEKLYKL